MLEYLSFGDCEGELPQHPQQPVEFPHSEEVKNRLRQQAVGYGWPKFGHDAEMKSLLYHVQLRDGLRNDMPGDYERKVILGELERQYAQATWRIPDDFMTYEHFKRCALSVDMSSSPGYPYLRRAGTNGDFLQVKDGVYNEARLQELWQITQLKIQEKRADPIRLFVKPEPHKQKKLENYQYRLISSVSVLDQIIDAMLFGEMNANVIDKCMFVPCKAGWSMFAGGWKTVPRRGIISLDKRGWDWSAQGWYFEMELQLRTRLCQNLKAQWMELAAWRYRELFYNPWFITSGGLLLQQKQPGVMKSGCFNTITTNSIMQSILHIRVCLELDIDVGWVWTLGDDTLQSDVEKRAEYLEAVAQYCHVKHCIDGAEFAGMRFLSGRVEPLYKGKHSFNLLHLDPKFARDTANSYMLLYHKSLRRSALAEMLQPLLGRVGTEERDAIWDGW